MFKLKYLFIFLFLVSFVSGTVNIIASTLISDKNIQGINIILTNPYGEIWFHNDSTNGVPTSITQNVWANISGWNQTTESGRKTNGFIVNGIGGNTLDPQIAGLYKLTYSISFEKAEGGANAREYNIDVMVNSVFQESTETHRTLTAQNSVGVVAGTGFLQLLPGDNVHLMVLSMDGSDDIGVHAANMNLLRIGD